MYAVLTVCQALHTYYFNQPLHQVHEVTNTDTPHFIVPILPGFAGIVFPTN